MNAGPFGELVWRHKSGEPVGVYSVCSAHPTVLAAAMRQALEDGSALLIEATSNQVDQFGGYTGMTPADFRAFVHHLADTAGFPRDRIVLGGDHLGPNRWQHLSSEEAMRNAVALVQAYAEAGYTKIHLDCSMPLQGDAVPLNDATVAQRAAVLLAAAEAAAADPGTVAYVIGSEVPVPGGAHETLDHVPATAPDAARATLAAHRSAIAAIGLSSVWPRLMSLVVQPGVEFDHLRVFDYDPASTELLSAVLDDEPAMVFEAHSTDYQLQEHLTELVENHWAVLKVGPGLTFALREATFALAAIEEHLVPPDQCSHIVAIIDQVMVDAPEQWQRYYHGDPDQQRLARRFSYSDRLRYYWPDERIRSAEDQLHRNLARVEIPLPLISQYLPDQYLRVRRGLLEPTSTELAIDRVRDALRPYVAATGANGAQTVPVAS